jgi:uncharacterized protein Usg
MHGRGIDHDFKKQLRGWSLTTAEITYCLPDFRSILQTYIWQDYDIAPDFRRLRKFLDFWSHNLEGPLKSVRVANAGIIKPTDIKHVDAQWTLH